MVSSYKNNLQSAKAFGSGDWDKVIEIETKALQHETQKQYKYSTIGMAYENKGDLDKAKESYTQAISIDEQCLQALEGLAGIYAKENNHDLAYQYVLRGLPRLFAHGFAIIAQTPLHTSCPLTRR